ncbi:ADP-ribose 1''-phosphate phosphatase [Oleoguttula sp. CCFEE 5521]
MVVATRRSKADSTSTTTKEVDSASSIKKSMKSKKPRSTHRPRRATPATKPTETAPAKSTHLTMKEEIGDLFDSPPNSILLHACNCRGSWGAGVAAVFKKKYPAAYKVHVAHCKATKAEDLLGTAQLIPPQASDAKSGESHWIACLFTSVDVGKKKGSRESILEATGEAMQGLLKQIDEVEESVTISSIRMPKINQGLFDVPWERTQAVLESIKVPGCLRSAGVEVVVVELAEEAKK